MAVCRSEVPDLARRRRAAARQRGRVHDLVLDGNDAPEAEAPGGPAREVQLAAPHERAPVVDADDGGPPGPPMDDADVRPERERAVGGRERLVVVALAAGGAPAGEGAGVTAGDGGVEGAGRRAQAARRDAVDALD